MELSLVCMGGEISGPDQEPSLRRRGSAVLSLKHDSAGFVRRLTAGGTEGPREGEKAVEGGSFSSHL